MPSITSWTRLEPRCRDADMARTVGARIFDPLWMLTRQWQTGEFQGEDAGTPVVARVRAQTALLSRCHLGELPANTQTSAAPYDSAALPLEVMVERQRVRPTAATAPGDATKLRLVVEGGLQFLRMLELQPLSRNYREAVIARYALVLPDPPALAKLDGGSARCLRSMAGRVPDARRLDAAFRVEGGGLAALDPALKVVSADTAEVQLAARAWLEWWDGLFSEPSEGARGSWLPERLEYAVSVAARMGLQPADERALTASEVYEGAIEWSDFDLDPKVNLGSDGDRKFESVVQTAVPAPVTFRGSPAPRFWELEDAQIDFGLMSTGPGDLANLLMIEYASSYGNDWFVVPLDLSVGSLTSVSSLVVTDTFGVRSLLRPLGDQALPRANWSMFQLARHRRPGSEISPGVEPNLHFLPPALGRSLQGPSIEEVLFLRDEMANLAWAVERTIEGALEEPLRRDDPSLPGGAAPVDGAASPAGLPLYRLASQVPAHWIPLLPVQLKGTGGSVQSRLKRGAVLLPDGTQQVRAALGELLAGSGPLLLHDEEVPREGVRVTRHHQLARWIDGSTFAWIGRRKTVGRGEGSSGLRFDRIAPATGGESKP
jgi:hypothetical protein